MNGKLTYHKSISCLVFNRRQTLFLFEKAIFSATAVAYTKSKHRLVIDFLCAKAQVLYEGNQLAEWLYILRRISGICKKT